MDSGTDDGQVDPEHVVGQLLGILGPENIKSNYQEMSRKLAGTFEKADEEDPFIGVRKGRMEWERITKKSKDPKVPHETEKEQTAVYKEVTEYGKWHNRQLFRAVEILQTITEFADKQSSPPSQIDPATSDLIELLTQHEEYILKHLLKEVDWNSDKQASAYGFF